MESWGFVLKVMREEKDIRVSKKRKKQSKRKKSFHNSDFGFYCRVKWKRIKKLKMCWGKKWYRRMTDLMRLHTTDVMS